jgi:hypothetical protein
MAKQGHATTNFGLRARPGQNEATIEFVRVGTPVDVIDDKGGEWLKVRADGKIGYANRKFVKISEGAASPPAEEA